MTISSSPTSIATCRRCGTCCRKGGPALHKEDRKLITSGIIPIKDLFTIRSGEWVSNQIKGMNEPTPTEIIKIKGIDRKDWRCRYFNINQKSCRIYADRPVECRMLKCWEPEAIAAFYEQDRLGRKDLLGRVAGLSELIDFHQAHCDHAQLNQWVKYLSAGDSKSNKKAQTAIVESIHWDLRIRTLAHEKANTDSDQFDFIFGRPLHDTLKILGWKIRKTKTGDVILDAVTP